VGSFPEKRLVIEPKEVLNGSHVAWQGQKILFPMGKEVHSYAKHFHCSCHATWLPYKTSIAKQGC